MSVGNIIHEQVEKYLDTCPEFRPYVRRLGEGEYFIDGREVKVGFCREGYLVVHDGPLRQPFTDYVEKKDGTAVYCKEGLKNSNLISVPKETRISFDDQDSRYSRLDAMKVAKEQAIFREKAAGYLKEGQFVPADLREKYEKTIDIKLGKRRWTPKPEKREPEGPAWWPGAPASAATAPAPQPQPQQQQQAPQQQPPPPPPQQSQLPLPAMPSVGPSPPPVNLFGQMPDLFQLAAARCQQPSLPLGKGTLSVPLSAPNAFSVALKAPMGLQGMQAPRRRSSVAGAMFGA